MKASDIPTKFPIPWGNDAASSFIRAIPETTADPDAASLDLGFPPNTATPVGAGGVPPNVADFNGILNEATAWLRWGQAGGLLQYDSAFSTTIDGYPKGACLLSASLGNLWFSLVDDNLTDPDTGGAGWIAIQIPAPVAGAASLLTGSAPGGTKTASWTASELVAAAGLGGRSYKGTALSLAFNGAGTGANGMDTGSPPVSNDLNVYAIYNPTTGTWATLGTTACSGPVYTGANAPSGYTASALIWAGKTDASRNIVAFQQVDRTIYVASGATQFSIGSTSPVLTSIASGVPAAARTCGGTIQSNGGVTSVQMASAAVGIATCFSQGGIAIAPFDDIGCVGQAVWTFTSPPAGSFGVSKYTI